MVESVPCWWRTGEEELDELRMLVELFLVVVVSEEGVGKSAFLL